jgi:membrane protease YdiL (CAAX protease family)
VLSEKPWRAEAVIVLGAGLLFSLSLGSLLNVALGSLAAKGKWEDVRFYQYLVGIASFQGVALILTGRLLQLHGMTWREFLGAPGGRLRRCILIGLVGGACVVPMAMALNHVSQRVLEQTHIEATDQLSIQYLRASVKWWQQICFGVTAIVLAPLVEEIIFRGILYPAIKQRGYPGLAWVGTALLFAAIHMNVKTFLPLAFIGFALVWLYERTDSLATPIAAHALFNATNFFVLLNEQRVQRWIESLHRLLKPLGLS